MTTTASARHLWPLRTAALALSLVAGLAAVPASVPAAAQEAGDPAPETPYPWNSAAAVCDRTAGDPADVNAQLATLVRAAADLAAAAAACRDALAAAPDDLRLRFQSGRILLAAGERAGLQAIESAAQAGYPPAELFLGIALRAGAFGSARDAVASAKWIERAAQAGVPLALLLAGRAYENGTGVARNLRSAEAYYAAASEAGQPEAMVSLGAMLLGLTPGPSRRMSSAERERGYRLLSGAADLGMASADFLLGLAFAAGQGVSASNERAIAHLERAAEAGSRQAALYLGANSLPNGLLTEDLERARRWLCNPNDPGLLGLAEAGGLVCANAFD